MAKEKPGTLQIETFADHRVITQPNPLRKVLRRIAEQDLDDPVARAEKALAGLSGEFKNWMAASLNLPCASNRFPLSRYLAFRTFGSTWHPVIRASTTRIAIKD